MESQLQPTDAKLMMAQTEYTKTTTNCKKNIMFIT